MTDDQAEPQPVPMTEDGIPLVVNGQELTEIQIQALREAKERRDKIALEDAEREVGGANRTTNPTRFGDWEKDGRAVDFS